MSLGELYSRVLIDQPLRTRYGPTDPLNGTVLLQYYPKRKASSPQPDLFGPLVLNVVLRGRLRYKVDSDVGSDYRLDKNLFTASQPVFNGAFKASPNEKVEIPFSTVFPERVSPSKRGAPVRLVLENGHWVSHVEEQRNIQGDDLPPSMQTRFQTLGDQEHVTIDYHLTAEVDMPGIDIKHNASDWLVEVRYEQPRPPPDPFPSAYEWTSQIKIQSSALIPPYLRPQGLKEKAKALLQYTDDPTFTLDLLCTAIPPTIHQNRPIRCVLAARPNAALSTALSTPPILFKSFTVEVLAYTSTQIPGKNRAGPVDIQTVCTLTGHSDDPDPAFSKATDWTKTITTDALRHVPSSFRIEEVERSYKLRILVQVQVAGDKRTARRDFPVVVRPPAREGWDEPAAASSSSQVLDAVDLNGTEEELPSYGAAVGQEAPPGF